MGDGFRYAVGPAAGVLGENRNRSYPPVLERVSAVCDYADGELKEEMFCIRFASIDSAKEAHAVSPHFAQIMYFAAVSALFSAPFHFTFSHATVLLRSFLKIKPLSFVMGLALFTAGILSVHFFRIRASILHKSVKSS